MVSVVCGWVFGWGVCVVCVFKRVLRLVCVLVGECVFVWFVRFVQDCIVVSVGIGVVSVWV